jgi:low temperature requirement protein LtrA
MTNYEPTTFPYGSFFTLIGICVGIYLFFKYFRKLCKHISDKNGGEVPPGKVAFNLYVIGVFLLVGATVVNMVANGGLADWYEIRLLIYQVIVILYCGFVFPIAGAWILEMSRTKGAPVVGGSVIFGFGTMAANMFLMTILGL